MRFLALVLTVAVVALDASAADVPVVTDGAPQAVVVLAEEATPVAQYAAEELVHHVQKATGVKLAIASETAIPDQPPGRVFIGDTKAARAAGIEAGKLPPETFVLRTQGNALFIAGGDGDGPPLDVGTPAGTLFGVYELLEEALGVRWLWPGDLGEFVPKVARLVVPEIARTVAPRFMQRNIRAGLGLRGATGGFSPEALRKVAHDQAVWLRRMRMGHTVKLHSGHAFTDWGKRYGQEHPDWFNLLENGKREFSGSFSMCVSNPGFHEQIIKLWKEQRAQHPGEFININCCENDIDGLCTCPSCRAWDGPEQKPITDRYGRRCVSDRYARYWLTVQQLASREDPEATVVAYAYVNYAPPPATDIKLNKHILVGTVPDIFFPRSPGEQEWVIQQWQGWARTGCRLFLRPNYMLEGYCMPHLFMHQFAEEFQFDAKHEMAATDFDSLTAMWSAQGPNLYLLGRMHVRPEKDADALLAEYYSGFGAAAGQVKAYFDYWEKYMADNRDRHREIAKKLGGNWTNYAVMAHEIFPQESFAPAVRFLDEAAKATANDPVCAARVEFLRKGLTHAQLVAKVAAVMAGKEGRPSPVACGKALAELAAFRKTIEMDNVANLNFCAWTEQRAWKAQEGYSGEALKPLSVETSRRGVSTTTAPAIPVRGLHTFVALLNAGEHFRARVACKRIGHYTATCEWTVFAPDDQRLAQGVIEPGKEAVIEAGAGAAGVYCLVVNSGTNVAAVTPLNPHAALAGRNIHLLGGCDSLSFFVPEGVMKFTVTLATDASGETASMTITDPDGKPVATVTTGKVPKIPVDVQVPIAQSGKAWSLKVEKGGGGVLEDVMLSLDSKLPPYWSRTADSLLAPAR